LEVLFRESRSQEISNSILWIRSRQDQNNINNNGLV